MTVTAALLAGALVPGAAGARIRNGAVAYSADRAGARVIYARESNGTRLRILPTGERPEHPAFSPQGRRFAFTRYGDAGAQIFVSYLDGTGLRSLTTGPADGMAAWAPTGDRLVFARGPRSRRDLYTIAGDGSDLRRLTLSRADDRDPSWSPRRDRIAFVRSARGRAHVYVVSARGGSARRLTRGKLDQDSPAWSPTGHTLVVSRGRAGRRDLFLVTADGAHARRLTRVRGDETEAAWSPDGSRIAFVHRAGGVRRIYVMKVRGRPVTSLPRRSTRVRRLTAASSAARSPSWQARGVDPVVAAAGDIACDPESAQFNAGAGLPGVCRQRMTSDLLLRGDLAAILAVGDIQYEDAQLRKFQASFDPSWGRLKPLIRPAPGNHEYKNDPAASGYFDYFNGPGNQTGQAGDRSAGYYSFEAGRWHVVALNSECTQVGGCEAGGPQESWLRTDLAAHPATCTLVYWHHPRFSSGRFDDGAEDVLPLWDAIYDGGVDVVLNGHEHFYERFAPQTPSGAFDPARGVRQFTVGIGGKGRFGFATVAPNSEVRDNHVLGVLTLTLRDGSYGWQLLAAPRADVRDSGSARCH